MRASKTALIDAVRGLDIAAATAILEAAPALLKTVDRSGRNLLHLACMTRSTTAKARAAQVRMATLLLDRGLAIDEPYGRDRCTPLFEAVARARNPDLVTFLLRRGADVHAAPGGALFAAAWWQDVDILRILLDAGADPDIVVGVTPFLASWCSKRFDAAKFLAAHGADINVQDPKGRTALYHGVEREFDPALLAWLVRHGASPDIEDADGVSARMKASRKRNQRFARALTVRT